MLGDQKGVKAPLAEPGLMKKRESYSNASNLSTGRGQRGGAGGKQARGQKEDVLVGSPRDEYVHVHLARDCAEGLCVAERDDLVPVQEANLERAVLDQEGGRQRGILQRQSG